MACVIRKARICTVTISIQRFTRFHIHCPKAKERSKMEFGKEEETLSFSYDMIVYIAISLEFPLKLPDTAEIVTEFRKAQYTKINFIFI